MKNIIGITQKSIVPWIFFLIAFIINPTITLIIVSILVITTQDKLCIAMFMVALAMWLGVINMTKIPSSDQLAYLDWYRNVDSSNFIKSVIGFRYISDLSFGEPAFNLFSVIIYFISGGNEPFYFFSVTVFAYLLQFISIRMFAEYLKLPKSYFIMGILMHAFFMPFFVQSVHVIRQILAESMMIYAITYRIVTGKNNWFFIILSILCHVSTALFLSLSLIPSLYKSNKVGRSLSLIIIFMIVFLGSNQLLGNFFSVSSLQTFELIGSKIGNIGTGGIEEGQMQMSAVNMYSIPFVIIVVSLFFTKGESSSLIYRYLFLMSYAIILLFSTNGTYRARFFIYMIIFMPYLAIALCGYYRRQLQILCTIIPFFYIVLFFIIIGLPRNYANMSEIVSSSFFSFLQYKY